MKTRLVALTAASVVCACAALAGSHGQRYSRESEATFDPLVHEDAPVKLSGSTARQVPDLTIDDLQRTHRMIESELDLVAGNEILSHLWELLGFDPFGDGVASLQVTMSGVNYDIQFECGSGRFLVSESGGNQEHVGVLNAVEVLDVGLRLYLAINSTDLVTLTVVEAAVGQRDLFWIECGDELSTEYNVVALHARRMPAQPIHGETHAVAVAIPLYCGCYDQGIGPRDCGLLGCIFGYECFGGEACRMIFGVPTTPIP